MLSHGAAHPSSVSSVTIIPDGFSPDGRDFCVFAMAAVVFAFGWIGSNFAFAYFLKTEVELK
jgi:hypothetical protein